MKTQREDCLLRAKEKGLEQILPSQPSKRINPGDTLILDFKPPQLGDNSCVLFQPPSLCSSSPGKLIHASYMQIFHYALLAKSPTRESGEVSVLRQPSCGVGYLSCRTSPGLGKIATLKKIAVWLAMKKRMMSVEEPCQ